MKVVDLTLPMIEHWRYPMKCSMAKSFKNGDAANVTHFDLYTHWYTHIDSPLHQFEGGKTLSDFPIDILVGKATILDVSEKVKENTAIDKAMLEAALGEDDSTKIILIKTCWDDKCDWTTTEFWDNAPYMTEEAAKYIKSLNPNVVGFDFPQDYDIRRLRYEDEHNLCLTTHREILKYDILMIEYMCNLKGLTTKFVDFVGLPLALPNADGAQIRCIGIVE